MLLTALLFAFALISGGDPMPAMPQPTGVTTTLTRAEGDLMVTFEVLNAGATPFRFCIFQTPLEDFRADILEVKDPSGAAMEYIGVQIKRGPPKDRHFVTLAPGANTQTTFALAKAYRLKGPGTYTVQYKGNPRVNGLPDSNVLEVQVE